MISQQQLELPLLQPGRQVGNTTRQMENAPPAAIFVWCVEQSISYAHSLARHLGRADLQIIGPFQLGDMVRRMRAREPSRRPALVNDHACVDHFTQRHLELLAQLREILEP